MENGNMRGLRHVGSVAHEQINYGQPVPLFEPAPPMGRHSINTKAGWNAAAEKTNARAFAHAFGRSPTCPTELKAWEDSHFSAAFCWEGVV